MALRYFDGIQPSIKRKEVNTLTEWGLMFVFTLVFGLPTAFSFGVMWAKTGRDEV